MIDPFTLLFASLLLQTPIALTTSLLVLRLRQLYGGWPMRILAAGWGAWAVRGALATYGYWLTRSGLPTTALPRRLTTIVGLAFGYALLPLLSAGTRGLAGIQTTPGRVLRWTAAAAVGGAFMGVLATYPGLPQPWRVRLNLSALSVATAMAIGILGVQLLRVQKDALTAGRQLAALGLLAYAAKQATNLFIFTMPTVAANVVVLTTENLVLVLAALGTLALLFDRQRVEAAAAATDRAAAERLALQATAQLGVAIDAIAEPIALADATMALSRANPAFVALVARLGRGEAVPGFPLAKFARPEMRDRWTALFERVRSGEAVQLKYPLPIDGEERTYDVRMTPVAEGGRVEGVLVALRDVTADESLRRELAAREAYYRSLIEQSSDLITVLGLDGMTRYTSPSSERVLGWSPAQLVGRPALELVHPDDLPTMVAGFQQAQGDPTRRRTYTVRLRRSDGRYADVEMATSIFTQADGERLIIANARDLSERRALEEELLQAQRLDSLGRLAGGVAHDFNNLLTGMLAHAEFARDGAEDPAVVREELAEVEATARRAADLTRQLLTFARRERIAPTVFDVNDRLRTLGRLLDRVVGDAVQVATDLTDQPVLVRADGGQLEQAIVNLVVNARDAMPAGGTVFITTARLAVADALGGAPAVQIVVRDTGIGMTEETRRRIFEPFFTTKQGGRGTGLGLASVYGTITQAGGVILVTSAPGAGSTFELLLPVYLGPLPTAPTARLAADTGNTRTGRVLVVEDDPMVRRVVVKLLGKHGFVVTEAGDGAEALATWRADPTAYDVLHTDEQMPKLNGRALARELQLARPDLPVAYMSGYDADAVAAVPDAPDGPFIPKPFTEGELLDGVRRALERRGP